MNKALSFLAFGDLEARNDHLEKILEEKLDKYNLAVFTGDIPNPEIFKILSKKIVEKGLGDLGKNKNIAKETEPKEALIRVEKEFIVMNKVFEKINKRLKIIGVWGNADNTKMLKKVPVHKNIQIIHRKIFKAGVYNFIGYNGRPIYIYEKENKEQWAFEEESAYIQLKKLFEKVDPQKTILVTHAPPYGTLDLVEKNYRKYAVGTYGERAKDGHIGSRAFLKIDKEFKPLIHVFGHIHESKGIRKIRKTTFVNTGDMGKYYECAEFKLLGKQIKVRFLN